VKAKEEVLFAAFDISKLVNNKVSKEGAARTRRELRELQLLKLN
jgi:hypothetical protein